jgi:hypothetical protein
MKIYSKHLVALAQGKPLLNATVIIYHHLYYYYKSTKYNFEIQKALNTEILFFMTHLAAKPDLT